jgi:type IV pilus assembly protein PilY1
MRIKNMESIKNKLGCVLSGTLVTLLSGTHAVLADDTEIFTAYTSTSPNSNVVFVLDTSGSMANRPQGQTSGPSKIQIVKDVFEKLIFDPNNPTDHSTINPNNNGLKFALMRFDQGDSSNSDGGYFITRMQTLNNGTKSNIWDAVNGLSANGWTPLAETAYEATRYFRGDTEHFGNSSTPGTNANGIAQGNGAYNSPFRDLTQGDDCAINNHLVILTDGMPTMDGDADNLINTLTGLSCSFSDTQGTDCLPQVAQYLHNTDFLPNIDGVQNVKTHTIAFDLNQANAVALLQQTAQNGGGVHLSASGSTQLSDAITEVIRNVVRSAKSFVSPAISVSDTNRFVHDNTLYFGMFEPSASPKWLGNIKGYQLSEDGDLLDFSEPPTAALDANGEIAITARSKWSTTTDGAEIGAGGAASRIGLVRNIFTQNSTNGVVSFNGTTVSEADLGAANAAEKDAIINWARGRTDSGGSLRANPFGDPLHSTPQVVNYGGSTGSVIFFGTNEGFLHAIDADSGSERFALIPRSLLGNLKTFKEDILGSDRPYGLDGPITVYRKDANGDGQITVGGADEVILIVTMRRGGNQIFAFNVTDPDHPSLLWQITGGTGQFSALGQSWSKPKVTRINIGTINSAYHDEVVLFAGGYDEQYDDVTYSSAVPNSSIVGNAIYAVGLRDGVLKWSATGTTGGSVSATATSLQIPEMDDAIPSDLTYMDTNADGITDRIYAIDIVGRIFRIDFNTTQSTSGATQYVPDGKLFADISGNNRRFFYPVELVYTVSGPIAPLLHLNVGAGHRPHPLDLTSQDRFFSLWDQYVRVPLPTNFSPITTNDLTDTNTTPTGTINQGWYFDLPQGEKVLSKSLTLFGYTYFTTYTPPQPPAGPTCTPPTGSGKSYVINLFNSEAAIGDSRFRVLQATGIPPSPTLLALEKTPSTTGDPTQNDTLASQDTYLTMLVGTEDAIEGGGTVAGPNNPSGQQVDAFKLYWSPTFVPIVPY